MKSIKARFVKSKTKNPNFSSYLNFAYAVKNSRFSRQTILRNFTLLVDRTDYLPTEKKNIIDNLEKLSQPLSNVEIEEKNLVLANRYL